MIGNKRFFKKSLTNGGSGLGERVPDGPSAPASLSPGSPSLIPNDPSLSSPAQVLLAVSRSQPNLLRAIDSRDVPVSSLVVAEAFAKRFLVWCATADITGPIDWPKLFEHSQAYAIEEEIRPVTKMALSKALTKLGVKKILRELKNSERPNPRYRGQSDAKHPRVTVYVLPTGDSSSGDNEEQLKLFE